MSVDPEKPELTPNAVPLRWGYGGPVIGSAIIKEDGVVEGMITNKKYVDVLKPDIPQEYSIVNLNDLFVDESQYDYLFETRPAFAKKTPITIKKREETDG